MHEVKSIQDLLNQIGRDEILLPEFQRGYVWNRDQVRGLMQSLYRKHPTGHLLIWRTYKPSLVRGGEAARDGHSLLLLDGQQRLTTLYVLFRGKAPRFYEGESLFFDLHFNMQTAEFRFWQRSHMENNPAWIGVHEFLREGLSALLERLERLDEERRAIIQQNLARLSRLDKVRDYTYTVDQVSGDHYGVEEVVDIFNRVNSRGTPLTKADLALAHVCSLWPDARAELRTFSARMTDLGFDVGMNFLVRCLAGVATGSVLLEGSFLKTPAAVLQDAWEKMQPALERLVGVLRHDACIRDLDDLPTRNVLIPPTIYLARQEDGRFPTDVVRRRFVRWIFLAGLWARYSGATDTKLQQDVALVSGRDVDPTHELEEAILRERGRVRLQEGDLDRARINSAVARLSRIVARHRDARDWFTGVRIHDPVTGKSSEERHYIFPKRALEKAGFDETARIQAVANRALLGKPAPREYKAASPADYLPEVDRNQPGALRAQSVPMDRSLWRPERFLEFLAARRRLLAEAMNEFIAGWLPGNGADPEQRVRALIAKGESELLEFKSSLRWDRREERVNKALEGVVIKTLAGFLNRAGGTLLIGVDDGGALVGLAQDYGTLKKPDRDGFELHLQGVFARDLGESAAASFLRVNFHELDGQDICQVVAEPSDHAIYVEHQNKAVFYLRVGNGTKALPVDEAVKYVGQHWGKTA